jgi:hypothetical protein
LFLFQIISIIIIERIPHKLSEANNYQKEKNKANKLIRQFSFPLISPLELCFEYQYLSDKNRKYNDFLQIKNTSFATHWTAPNSRRYLGLKNFRVKSLEYFDEDFVPLFERVVSEKEEKLSQDLIAKKQISFFKRMILNFFEKNKEPEKENVIPISFEKKLANYLLFRLHHFTKCIEFVNVLDIPPDFYVELGIYNLHVFLLERKINKFSSNDRILKIGKYLRKKHKEEIKNLRFRFGLRSESEKYLDVRKMLETHDKLFEHHFGMFML